MDDFQKHQVKVENERIITEKGYGINKYLPLTETLDLRGIDEIKGRISIMAALVNIAFEAPIQIIKRWIESQTLLNHLSTWELGILNLQDDELSDEDLNSLYWYLEGLWALMWITKQIDNLDAEHPVGDNLVNLIPNLQKGEDNSKVTVITDLQQPKAIYAMLDYYYRLHWYCVEERLQGKGTPLNEGAIYERRRTLEWLANKQSDWDDIEMST